MAKAPKPEKPFDGAISRFVKKDAPKDVREALDDARQSRHPRPALSLPKRLGDDEYEKAYEACQLELVKMQTLAPRHGQRIVIVFEGRDAAGKGGTIKAPTENLNPRYARDVALPAPVGRRARAVVLPALRRRTCRPRASWCSSTAPGITAPLSSTSSAGAPRRARAVLHPLPEFEDMLVQDGIILIKVWLAIGRAEQLRQFLQRERDPLKQWKLSQTDIDGLSAGTTIPRAIREMFDRGQTRSRPGR